MYNIVLTENKSGIPAEPKTLHFDEKKSISPYNTTIRGYEPTPQDYLNAAFLSKMEFSKRGNSELAIVAHKVWYQIFSSSNPSAVHIWNAFVSDIETREAE